MTGPGRPTTGVRVDIRIPADLLDYIDTHAKTIDRSRADMIRRLLQLGMDSLTYEELADWQREGRP